MSTTAKFGRTVPVPLCGGFSLCDDMGGNLPVRPSSLAAGTQAASQPKRTGPRVCADFVSQP